MAVESVQDVGTLTVVRGDTFPFRLQLWEDDSNTLPYDLSAASGFKAEVRKSTASPVLATFAIVLTLPNILDLELSSTVTSGLAYGPGLLLWDVQITWPGSPPVVRTVANGALVVAGDITDSDTAVVGMTTMRVGRRRAG